MSRTRKYKRYSPEFKRAALKRASEDGITDKALCAELEISDRQLRRRRLVAEDLHPNDRARYHDFMAATHRSVQRGREDLAEYFARLASRLCQSGGR